MLSFVLVSFQNISSYYHLTCTFAFLIRCCLFAVGSLNLCALQMCLIFSEDSLADIRPPCVLQSFVNHGAVLHKVFVVGDNHFCVERPSLKNFPSGPCGQSAPHQQIHYPPKSVGMARPIHCTLKRLGLSLNIKLCCLIYLDENTINLKL